MFDSFAVSYKRFKERFVKVIIRPEAMTFFYDEVGQSRFPLYWTDNPQDFKAWPRPTGSDEEVEILSFFDALPRKPPCQMLIGAYAETTRWAVIRVMGLCFYVGRYFCSRLLPLVVFCFRSCHGSRQVGQC